MTKRNGMKIYVPPVVIEEIEDIMKEQQTNNRADAFKEFTRYAKVGREATRIMTIDFKKKEKNIDPFVVGSVFGSKRKY